MSFCYTVQPYENMRQEPSFHSRVVSQVLFAEPLCVEGEWGGWMYIRSPDGYRGWISKIACLKRAEPYKPTGYTSRLATHLYLHKDIDFGPAMTLPYGIAVEVQEISDPRWMQLTLPDGKKVFIQRGDIQQEGTLLHKKELTSFSKRFLGLPYTWGGRCSFGYDCSGFVQMLYQKLGIFLPRDAKDQMLDERLRSVALEDMEPGDLLFFGKEAKNIGHVGLFLGEGSFIHTSSRENKPWLRESLLSDPEWSAGPEVYYPYRVAMQFVPR